MKAAAPTVAEFANGDGRNTGGLRGLNNQLLALLRHAAEDIFGEIQTGPRLLRSPVEGFPS